jgi:hypothetical protein
VIKLSLLSCKQFRFSPVTGLFRREVNRLRNPFLAYLRAAALEALLQATEKELKNEIKLSQSQHARVVGWWEQKKLG